MFYTEYVGHRWATQSVGHKSLDGAEQEAERSSRDCSEVRVYDCTNSPSGVLVCVYRKGVRF